MIVRLTTKDEYTHYRLQCHAYIYSGTSNHIFQSKINKNIYGKVWGRYFKIDNPHQGFTFDDIKQALTAPWLDDSIVFNSIVRGFPH